MIFRKNYLPTMTIYQDFDGKWFAQGDGTGPMGMNEYFVQDSDLSYYVTFAYGQDVTKFETLDDLLAGLYEYAYKEHLEALKQKITYSKVKIHL